MVPPGGSAMRLESRSLSRNWSFHTAPVASGWVSSSIRSVWTRMRGSGVVVSLVILMRQSRGALLRYVQP
jgi:hypothetical protein